MSSHVALLPNDLWQMVSNSGFSSANFVRLPHPRTGLPALFMPHEHTSPENESSSSLLELQKVVPPNPRSWFIGEEVVSDGGLMFLSPTDPAFLLIYVLRFLSAKGDGSKFKPADDIFEDAALKLEESTSSVKEEHFRILSKDVRTFTSMKCCQDALARVCDVQSITQEIVVYRFSQDKAIEYLRRKVQRLSSAETTDSSRIVTRSLAKDGLMEDGKESLLELGRTKAACDLIAQYLTPEVRGLLLASYDFMKLDEHLRTAEEERMISDPTVAVGKKTKKAPEETVESNKRKKGAGKGSKGVEQLKKANINGMSKLSTFFAKKT